MSNASPDLPGRDIPERALTLWQPWAWLVAAGHKPIENRPRGFSHKSFRGDFWIHAGSAPKARSGGHIFGPELTAAWGQAGKLCHELLGGSFYLPTLHDLPFGAIIGRATITGIIPPRIVDGLLDVNPHEVAPVPWHFPDQYGFKVENARLLSKLVPCRGFQGFWEVPAPVLEMLRRAE